MGRLLLVPVIAAAVAVGLTLIWNRLLHGSWAGGGDELGRAAILGLLVGGMPVALAYTRGKRGRSRDDAK